MWCVCVCGWGECWCVLVGVRVVVVSDAHVFWLLPCLFGFVFCLVNNGLPWVWCGGLRVCGVVVVACCVFGVCACCLVVCAPPLVVGLVAGAGRVVFAPVGYWVVVLVCLVCARILCVCGLVLFLVCGV